MGPTVPGDPSPLPWRLIWTWHPVLEAFGLNKNANSSYSPEPWFYPAELFDNQKEVYKLLPAEIENYQDHVVVYPLYRLIVFHHTSKPRHKMINMLTSKLAFPGASEYFLSLKNRQPGAPLPTIPDWVNDVCARKLHDALLVLLKQRTPNDTSSWKTYAKTQNILVPDRPITIEEFHQTITPPTAADFPTLSDTVAPKPPAKPLVAAKKGSLTTQTTTALRPSVPLRPAQTLITTSPLTPAASPSLPSTTPDVSQTPSAPFPIAPATLSPAPPGEVTSTDIDMPPQTFSLPTSSLSGVDREKALRPLLHNATTISVQPASLPVPVSRPLVHELYAQAFALLPTIHTFYGLLTQKAKSLYDYLFNPAVTIVPEKEIDTASDTQDIPMPDATTGETPPTPMEISPTPFSQLVADYVNLDASFDDPGRLSAPEIQPSEYSTEPLDTPTFDGSMLNHYHDLLHFLHDQLSEYFSSVQDSTLPQNFFLTFIVGPPDHINARSCLHSHIIGCHVSPSQDYHSVLFVPVGPDGVWNGPLDWAPLFVYLLVTSLFPDLPCLVCTPAHQLRSFASLSALYTLFAPLSSSPCCPCIYFPSSEFVARGDIFLHLPDTSPAAHPDKPPPPFRITPPNEVIDAFSATRETHQQACYTWRAELLDSHTIAADQHFRSAQLSLLNLIRLLSSQPLDLFTSTSLPSFLKMKTSLWTMLDRLRRQASSDLNLSLFWLSPMKAFTMENLVGRSAFPSRRQIPLALLADSPPQSHSNKAPIVPRH